MGTKSRSSLVHQRYFCPSSGVVARGRVVSRCRTRCRCQPATSSSSGDLSHHHVLSALRHGRRRAKPPTIPDGGSADRIREAFGDRWAAGVARYHYWINFPLWDCLLLCPRCLPSRHPGMKAREFELVSKRHRAGVRVDRRVHELRRCSTQPWIPQWRRAVSRCFTVSVGGSANIW